MLAICWESARLKSITFVTGVPHVVGMDPIELSCVTEETNQRLLVVNTILSGSRLFSTLSDDGTCLYSCECKIWVLLGLFL